MVKVLSVLSQDHWVLVLVRRSVASLGCLACLLLVPTFLFADPAAGETDPRILVDRCVLTFSR